MASKLKAKDPKEAAPSRPKVLIYGKPGVGKTWAALDFPGVYYIDTEGGADLAHYTDKLKKAGGVYMGPEDGACDFLVLLDQVKALATEKHPYKTLVIDSISKVFNTAIALESEKLGDKNAFGADKKPAVTYMRQLVMRLQALDMNVILIAHEKVEWGMVDGERKEVGATFDCWDKLEYELHLALRIVKQGPARKAFVRKSRLTGFPEGTSMPWGYAEFSERYGRDVMEHAVTPVVLATPEQLKRLEELLDLVKVEDNFKDRCFTRAGVDKWADMKGEQISAVIAALEGKIK